MDKLEDIKNKLKKYGQEHLLLYYDRMDNLKREKLLEQIENIDFDLMNDLYESTKKPLDLKNVIIEPIEHTDKSKLTVAEREMYEEKGIEAIKDHKFATVTMAGGQGTRLGHSGPKGTFIFDTENNKSIFEALCDTLIRAWKEYNTVIPWYIMTSRENNDATVAFFESHNYFGYPKESVRFFKQGELPMLDLNGKILLEEDRIIKTSS